MQHKIKIFFKKFFLETKIILHIAQCVGNTPPTLYKNKGLRRTEGVPSKKLYACACA